MSHANKLFGTTLLAFFILNSNAHAAEALQHGIWTVRHDATLTMSVGDQPPKVQENAGDASVCISDRNSVLPDAFADNFALKSYFRYECDFSNSKEIQDPSEQDYYSLYEISYTCKPPVGRVSGTIKIKFSEYDGNDNDGSPSQIAFIHVNQSMKMGQSSGSMKLAMTARSPAGKSCN